MKHLPEASSNIHLLNTAMALKEIPSSFNLTRHFIKQLRLKGITLISFTRKLPFRNV